MAARTKELLAAPDLDAEYDAGFVAASARAQEAVARTPDRVSGKPLQRPYGAEIRVGTASWTDSTMTRGGVFYPRGTSTAEERLRYYASQFSTVEVDASYYSLPDRNTVALWAERTPDDFVFHVKAHALMTGQPTEVRRLPQDLVDLLPPALANKQKVYDKDLPLELLEAVWTHFIRALEPLQRNGKLGGILLQYPRWFIPSPQNRHFLAESARRLDGISATVEFRHQSWFATERAAELTLGLLRELGLTHVIVDGPQGLASSIPPVPGVTTPELAMVRLHGRRSHTWEAPNVPTVERYRYLYSRRQLEHSMLLIEQAATEATRTIVFFNNCYGNYGSTNAREMIELLSRPTG